VRRIWLVFGVALAACGPGSIEDLCAEASAEQCARCYSCGLDGAALCNLAAGTDEEACSTSLVEQCVDQAATVESPKSRLRECAGSFEELTCDQIVAANAQGGAYATSACAYFL